MKNFHDELVQTIKGRVAIYQEDTVQQESYIEEMENYKFADSVE